MAAITTVFLLMVVGCTGPVPPQPGALQFPPMLPTANGVMSKDDIAREVRQLRTSLLQEVPQHSTTDDDATWFAGAKAAVNASPFRVDHVQLMVVVDRSPAVQQMRVILAQPDGQWQVIGGSKVSTGQSGRRGYFITPLGVFLHTDDILDYRALGTFNENHIRGLGLEGMRVWDFGWQSAERGWHAERDLGEIRLLMHATDPDYLEQRLGSAASQGCIRIPATMNRFLDVHGVLDADYERAAQSDSRLLSILLPDRQPSPLAGNALVVLDSAQAF